MLILRLLQPIWQPFGVDLFCFGKKFLVFNLVSRNLKTKYRRSVMGVFWTLLSPMATAGVYYLVFNIFLKIKIPHYLPFILSGVLTFNFFSQSLVEGMESIVGNGALASKVPMPLQVFPYVGVLTNWVTLILSIPIMIIASLISHVSLGPSLLVLPFYLVILLAFTYGIGLLSSILFVFFRDLRHLMGIVIQLWLYATPVIYNDSMIPDKFRWIIFVNPMSSILISVHTILVEGSWPSLAMTWTAMGWAISILMLAAIVHKKMIAFVAEQI